VVLDRFKVQTSGDGPTHDARHPLKLGFAFTVERTVEPFHACISIFDIHDRLVIKEYLPLPTRLPAGPCHGTMELPSLLHPGAHRAAMWLGSAYERYAVSDAVYFDITGPPTNHLHAPPVVRPIGRWDLRGPDG
jgi:hypothetical protein